MKLRKIKWANHPVLRNLELDFTSPEGNACDTIVIAGENGLGKTTILETLYSFLREGTITPFEHIEYEVDGGVYKAFPLENTSIHSFFNIEDRASGTVTPIRCNRSTTPQNIVNNPLDPRHYGCAYTKAQAEYVTKKIDRIATSTLDNDAYKDYAKADAASLKQLLVDIQNLDNTEFREFARAHNGDVNLESTFNEQFAKMQRFASAFNQFFEELTYRGIEQKDGAHEIVFEKHGHLIGLDDLSTGEKQIVFRGTFLLKNLNSMLHGVVFIDEPEISMHPRWQKKILDYYRNLFVSGDNQMAQLIVATHSGGVVASAVATNNARVITLQANGGSVTLGEANTPLLFRGNANEINYLTFGTDATEYHDVLYGCIGFEGWMGDYKNGRATVTYNRQHRDGSVTVENICLSEKIRHMIHHPENAHNAPFTVDEIQESIDTMRNFIKGKRGIH